MDPDVRIALEGLERRIEELERRFGGGLPVDSAPGWSAREFGSGDDPEVVELLRSGHKINAIKVHRERTGLGLGEAKDAVEEIERRLGL